MYIFFVITNLFFAPAAAHQVNDGAELGDGVERPHEEEEEEDEPADEDGGHRVRVDGASGDEAQDGAEQDVFGYGLQHAGGAHKVVQARAEGGQEDADGDDGLPEGKVLWK